MDQLMDRFLSGFRDGSAEIILSCFWPDAIIISSDFEPLTYDDYIPKIKGILNSLDNLQYKIIFQDSRCISTVTTVEVGGIILRYYITTHGDKRGNELKITFLHFSPCPDETQESLVWIARKLAELEEVGLFNDINRLELQRHILRLERENEELSQALNHNHNLMATGRVEKLNPNTNPAIFRLTGYNINQAFFIDPLLLKAIGLKNGLLVKVKHSDPVPNNRGQGETKFWMVRDLEIIEMLDRNEPNFK